MGLLGKLFGAKEKETVTATAVVECPHAVLVPRWDSVQDMGREDKITRYMCEACHQEFSPDVAVKLRDTVNERVEATWEQKSQASNKA